VEYTYANRMLKCEALPGDSRGWLKQNRCYFRCSAIVLINKPYRNYLIYRGRCCQENLPATFVQVSPATAKLRPSPAWGVPQRCEKR